MRRCELEKIDVRHGARGRPERESAQLEVETQLREPALAKRDPGVQAAGASEGRRELGRQESGEPRKLDPLRLEVDAPGQVPGRSKRAEQLGLEADPCPERLGKPGRAPGDYAVPVTAQHHVDVTQGPGRGPCLEVAHLHRGIGDLHMAGGQPVEVEWRSIGRPLVEPEQAKAAVREAQNGDGRPDEADASGDKLASAQRVPQIQSNAALAHREHWLAAIAVEQAQVLKHKLRAVPAQPRVQSRELESKLGLPLHPGLDAIGARGHCREHDPQQKQEQCDRNQQAGNRDSDAAQPAWRAAFSTGSGGMRVRVHIRTTSYWSIR